MLVLWFSICYWEGICCTRANEPHISGRSLDTHMSLFWKTKLFWQRTESTPGPINGSHVKHMPNEDVENLFEIKEKKFTWLRWARATTRPGLLDWWTRYRTITAKHTAITFQRFNNSSTAWAFVKELTCICRHYFFLGYIAVRAGKNRF